MSSEIVLLRSEMVGEDHGYTICAVEINTQIISVEEFGRRAKAMMDSIREQDDYEVSDLIVALRDAGFIIVKSPEEIVVLE